MKRLRIFLLTVTVTMASYAAEIDIQKKELAGAIQKIIEASRSLPPNARRNYIENELKKINFEKVSDYDSSL